MSLKGILLLLSMSMILHGCVTTSKVTPFGQEFDSPQTLIDGKRLNEPNGAAKAYVYSWGKTNSNRSAESLLPRQYLGQYCQTQGGQLRLLYKSQMSLIKDHKTKTGLAKQANVS